MPHSEADPPAGERPLAGYGALSATFVAVVASALALLRRRDRMPERISMRTAVRVGIATHKLARMIAKDKVTSPYRARFVRFEGAEDAPPAEVHETPRGSGLRLAFGELLVCPYCLAPWIATVLHVALATVPREARLLVAILESVTVADFLQIAYKGFESRLL